MSSQAGVGSFMKKANVFTVASCFHIFRLIFDEMISFDILMDMVFGFLHI